MEDFKITWNNCLQTIRQKVNNERAYKVWFADIEIESYNAEKNTIVLRVPSSYVYEYLEMYCTKFMSQVLNEHFKPGISLGYRIVPKLPNSQTPKLTNSNPLTPSLRGRVGVGLSIPHFSIPNARQRLMDELQRVLGEGYQWIPAYDKVVDWLSDNKGKGLLCVGTCGLGKTIICRDIIPAILHQEMATCTAQEMNNLLNSKQGFEELLQERYVMIDDLGKEDPKPKRYGSERQPFFEICTAAEQQGHLMIITTNLSTTPASDPRYPSSILERYGNAVISRLRTTTRVIVFEGKDMRG